MMLRIIRKTSFQVMAKLALFEEEHCEKGNCTWSTEKCLVKRKTASYANTVEQLTL